MRTIAALALGALVSLTAAADAGKEARAGAAVGRPAPELDAATRTAQGKHFQLKQLRGKWVVITFGASWCGPCKKELAAWDTLAGRYVEKATFVAVNIDNDPRKGERFVEKLQIRNLRVVYSPEEDTTSTDAYLGDKATFPTTFVIDPVGKVRHVHAGYRKGDEHKLARTLDTLIAK
jgi:thiol-disulfide isomerase/thioredoxin